MFHQVKILDPKGKVKKVISPKSLSQRYWGDFFNQNIKAKSHKAKAKESGAKQKQTRKRKNEMSYEDLYFSED